MWEEAKMGLDLGEELEGRRDQNTLDAFMKF